MYKTTGTADMEKALRQLGKNSGFAALTGALRDASKPIVKSTRAAAPKKTGNLRKNIKTVVYKGKGKSDSVATLHIGFNKKAGFYGRFLELGAKRHRIPGKTVGARKNKRKNNAKVSLGANAVYSNIDHPGNRPKPFLAKGFEAGYKQAIPIFVKRLRERIILQAIKKYGKGA
jgi:HK97 gp10 family phage protein